MLWSFRPRVLPMMATAMGLSLVAVFAVIWFRLPAVSRAEFSAFQRITLLFFAGVVLWILYRMATVRIIAYADILAIRNVFRSYRVEWRQVQVLRFSRGDPWLQLFDAEGNRLGVLAIQTADGLRSAVAARKLAEIARSHGSGPQQLDALPGG